MCRLSTLYFTGMTPLDTGVGDDALLGRQTLATGTSPPLAETLRELWRNLAGERFRGETSASARAHSSSDQCEDAPQIW